MLYDGVSLIPVLIIVVLLDLLLLQLMLLHHKLTEQVIKYSHIWISRQDLTPFMLMVFDHLYEPVWILDDASVNPLLQDFKVRDTGRFSEVEAQLLSLAVTCVVEGPVMEEAQGCSTHTLSFVHRGRCENGRTDVC